MEIWDMLIKAQVMQYEADCEIAKEVFERSIRAGLAVLVEELNYEIETMV